MLLIYNLAIRLYGLGIWIASFFHAKAKSWIAGRQHLFEELASMITTDRPIIWIHCASLGEFEQARPLIEELRSKHSQYQLLLSFYSPSGFEIRKNYDQVDYVCYLPLDTAYNAQRFIQIVQPSLVIFVKYEFWYHFLQQLKKAAIPTFLISAVFRPKQLFFKTYGQLFRNMLHCFQHIFVQDQRSFDLLQSLKLKTSIAGDTRIDRVIDIAKQAKRFAIIEKFVDQKTILIAGSTWVADEDILCSFINTHNDADWKYIIAPHEIKEKTILALENKLTLSSIRYSVANKNINQAQVLIIDNIGMLSAIYQYGKIAFIGGGFGKGIHNILEPIAFGLPVIFGPNYTKFEEAKSLVDLGAAFSIKDTSSFNASIAQFSDNNFYQDASQKTRQYLKQNEGATEKILKALKPLL